jgi:hypothetical protein
LADRFFAAFGGLMRSACGLTDEELLTYAALQPDADGAGDSNFDIGGHVVHPLHAMLFQDHCPRRNSLPCAIERL